MHCPIFSIQEGIVSPSDLDLVMSDGLGMRYAFIGPLETMHLNAEGMLCFHRGEDGNSVLFRGLTGFVNSTVWPFFFFKQLNRNSII